MFTECLLVGVLVWYVIAELLNRRERSELLDRLMAKDLGELKYYKDKWPTDAKVSNQQTENAEKADARIQVLDKNTADFLRSMDEDWAADDIDTEKLREIVSKENIGVTNEPENYREENPSG